MNLLVSSPMRTGSTWLTAIMQELFRPQHQPFVNNIGEANAALQTGRRVLLKSHSLIDIDLEDLRHHVHCLCITRNYKDALISRALYCRNVRPAQGLKTLPAEKTIIDRCAGWDDVRFLNIFLSECPLVPEWLGQIVAFERGGFDYLFYYEMLLHNPRAQLELWMQNCGLSEIVGAGAIDEALKRTQFKRMRDAHTKGFIGSTGVGRWMDWLDDDVATELDKLYLLQKDIAARQPGIRNPAAAIPLNP